MGNAAGNRSRSCVAIAASMIALVACEAPPPPVIDGGSDAAALDAPVIDGGSDASSPAWPRFCGVCHRDEDCAAGALCLVLDGGVRRVRPALRSSGSRGPRYERS